MSVFDVQKWVCELEDLTFPTTHAAVTWEEGVAIQHFFQEGVCRQRDRVTAEDRDALEALRGKLRALLAELVPRCADGGFFVRMGSRSPKDATMAPSEPWGVSAERIRAVLERAADAAPSSGTACVHEVLRRFQTASCELLRVSSAEEAVALLVSSFRVMQDVSHTLDHGRPGWDMSVVARAWDADVSLEREVRAFVVGGEVAAISQYDDQLCSELIAEHPEEIVGAVLRGLDQARHGLQKLGFASPASAVVMDFLVVPPSADAASEQAWTARLIELNPFGPMTGAALFSWTQDRRVLQRGVDLYGDLAAWEERHPPDTARLPAWIAERSVGGVPIRFLAGHAPSFTWAHLEAIWPDYVSLAPSTLVSRVT